jgi:hypothetical protein
LWFPPRERQWYFAQKYGQAWDVVSNVPVETFLYSSHLYKLAIEKKKKTNLDGMARNSKR